MLPQRNLAENPRNWRRSRAAVEQRTSEQSCCLCLWGFRAELLFRYRPAELLANFDAQLGSLSQCQLAPRTQASNRLKGWVSRPPEKRMLWTIFAILLLLWLLGWGFHIAGSFIHLILVIALVVLLIEVITGRRAAV